MPQLESPGITRETAGQPKAKVARKVIKEKVKLTGNRKVTPKEEEKVDRQNVVALIVEGRIG